MEVEDLNTVWLKVHHSRLHRATVCLLLANGSVSPFIWASTRPRDPLQDIDGDVKAQFLAEWMVPYLLLGVHGAKSWLPWSQSLDLASPCFFQPSHRFLWKGECFFHKRPAQESSSSSLLWRIPPYMTRFNYPACSAWHCQWWSPEFNQDSKGPQCTVQVTHT